MDEEAFLDKRSFVDFRNFITGIEKVITQVKSPNKHTTVERAKKDKVFSEKEIEEIRAQYWTN